MGRGERDVCVGFRCECQCRLNIYPASRTWHWSTNYKRYESYTVKSVGRLGYVSSYLFILAHGCRVLLTCARNCHCLLILAHLQEPGPSWQGQGIQSARRHKTLLSLTSHRLLLQWRRPDVSALALVASYMHSVLLVDMGIIASCTAQQISIKPPGTTVADCMRGVVDREEAPGVCFLLWGLWSLVLGIIALCTGCAGHGRGKHYLNGQSSYPHPFFRRFVESLDGTAAVMASPVAAPWQSYAAAGPPWDAPLLHHDPSATVRSRAAVALVALALSFAAVLPMAAPAHAVSLSAPLRKALGPAQPRGLMHAPTREGQYPIADAPDDAATVRTADAAAGTSAPGAAAANAGTASPHPRPAGTAASRSAPPRGRWWLLLVPPPLLLLLRRCLRPMLRRHSARPPHAPCGAALYSLPGDVAPSLPRAPAVVTRALPHSPRPAHAAPAFALRSPRPPPALCHGSPRGPRPRAPALRSLPGYGEQLSELFTGDLEDTDCTRRCDVVCVDMGHILHSAITHARDKHQLLDYVQRKLMTTLEQSRSRALRRAVGARRTVRGWCFGAGLCAQFIGGFPLGPPLSRRSIRRPEALSSAAGADSGAQDGGGGGGAVCKSGLPSPRANFIIFSRGDDVKLPATMSVVGMIPPSFWSG